jgi:glutaredoxin-related protein
MEKKIRLKTIDPITVGAPKRSNVAMDNDNNIYIVKNIKSRIIMKDGLKLFDLAKKIKTVKNTTVCLATTAPVCSKTKKYLKKNEIKITSDYIVK